MKRKWKIIVAVFGIIILAFGIGSWYLSRYWKPILNERLQIIVSTSSDSLYSLTYDEFDFSWYSGNAYLTNVSLTPNETVYKQLRSINKAPDNQYTIRVRSIKLINFHPRLLYQKQKLNIDEILIEDPTVMIVNENLSQDSLMQKEMKTPYQQISKFLKEIRVNDLKVSNLNFTYQNRSLEAAKETKLKNVNISIQDFLIDSISQKDTSRIYYSAGLDFKMDTYQIATRDSMYHINFKVIDFSTSKKQLKIDRVEMQPRHSKTDFYKVVDTPTDRFDLAFDSLAIHNIDVFQFLKNQRFYASKISTKKGFLEVYNNANYQRAKKNKVGKDPHQQLQKLAWIFNIDTVSILNTNIIYEELNKTTQQKGRVTFNNSNTNFFNVTNDSVKVSQDSIMHTEFEAKFMKSAQLKLNFRFNLASSKGAFTYQGKLNPMNGLLLNQVLKPLAEMQIASANINSLTFNFEANQKEARGKVDFRYTDLKINLLKKDQSGSLSQQKVVSTIANNFIINRSNPAETGEYIQANIYYDRPRAESFFKLLWKSIFQGIKTSAGIDEEREARLKNTASNSKQVVKDTKKAAKKVGGFIRGIFEKKDNE